MSEVEHTAEGTKSNTRRRKNNMRWLLGGIAASDTPSRWYAHMVDMLKSQDYPELEQYILARMPGYNTIPQFLAAWENSEDEFDNLLNECVGKFYLEEVWWPERTCGDPVKEDVASRYLASLHPYTLALAFSRFLKLEDEDDE